MFSPSRTLARPTPRPGRPLRPGGGALVALGLVAFLPVAAAAQQVTDEVALLRMEDEYEAAVLVCQGAVRAREAHQPEYDLLIQQADRVDPGSEAWRAAQTRLLTKSQVIQAAQDRVAEVCGTAEEARVAYLEGIDALQRSLEGQLDASESPQRARNVRALLIDLENRYDELEEERDDLALQVVMRPVYDIDPRNTPEDVRRKADVLENLIARMGSLLTTFDDELERLESRLARQQRRENFEANVARYGDTRTPVGTDPQEGDEPASVAPDSTGLSGQTLEERIESLRSLRLNLEYYREGMRERLDEFRAYLRRTT